MAQIFKKRYRTFIDCHGERVDPLHDYDVSTTYYVGDDGEEFDNVSQVVSEIVDNGKYDIPSLPKVGTWVEQDELYTHDGQVYKVRQSHRVTIYDPAKIPALFTIYRKEATGDTPNEWIAGEKVDVGVQRTSAGKTWECIQAHVTDVGWEPENTPALWKEAQVGPGYPIWVQPTGAHDAYNIGDIVWYPTENSTLYRSLIDANVWSPDAYPAGWEIYTP